MKQISNQPKKLSSTVAITCLGLTLGSLSASGVTLGHWTFDSGNLETDSSGNGYTLENSGVTQSGDKAVFSGAANIGLDTNADIIGEAGTSFTIESILSPGGTGGRRPIASEYVFDNSQNSGWEFYLNGSNGLRFAAATSNTSEVFYVPTFVLETGKEYFVAAAVDATAVVNNNGSNESMTVTFYYQNLTDSGELLSESITATNQGNFGKDSVGYTFAIGNRQDFTLASSFNGTIDEVRVSSGLLDSNQFITAIPEPGHYAVLIGLGAVGLAAHRRRQALS